MPDKKMTVHKSDLRSRLPQWGVSLLVAVLFGLACVGPNILQLFDPTYQGIPMMGTDEESYYANRIRAVERGEWPVSNAYYSAPKDQPYMQPAVPEASIYWAGKLIGLSAVTSFVASKFVLGMLLTLVLIGCWTSITRRPWLSIVVVCTTLFANAFLNAPWNIVDFFHTGIFASDFLRFARPINPQWSSTWFFLMVWILSEWIRHPRHWKAALAGCCMAVLLYSYLYAWSYMAAALGLLFLWYGFHKQWSRCIDIMIIFGLFLLLGIPYFQNLWAVMHHPWYAETSIRIGMTHGRSFQWGAYGIAFIIAALPSRRILPAAWPLLPAFALAGMVAFNQQLITGMEIVYEHYHWYFVQPFAALLLITLVLLGILYVVKPRALQIAGLTALSVFSLWFGFSQQWNAYQVVRAEWSDYQPFKATFDELSVIGHTGQVVYISQENGRVRELIPLYTPLSMYTSQNSNAYLTPESRAREIMFFELWLKGLTADQAAERFPTDLRAYVSSSLYSIYYRQAAGGYDKIPDDIIAEQIALYKIYLTRTTQEKLKLYPLDFVLRTQKDIDTPEWRSLRALGTEVSNTGGTLIVQFKS